MNIKKATLVSALVLGLIIGVMLTVKLNLSPIINAESRTRALLKDTSQSGVGT